MAGLVPADFIETVRSRTDIVEMIGEYVVLKRAGQNYLGLCPFHQEKTPSFTVSPSKQIFYCFGCSTGGSAFTFLMKRDHLTFHEAVEALARRLGLELPEEDRNESALMRGRREHFDLNAQVADYYHKILTENQASETARAYLRKRGLHPRVWDQFTLGFAPASGQALLDAFTKKGFGVQSLSTAGLLVNRQGGVQDRFRGRIIFPIYDARGRCLGFGGRALGDEQPKYLNSPETGTFSKSRNLYGLNFALPAIRERGNALVVEGYMDCITAHQHGFSNAVASLGTAFTRDQAGLLVRYTQEVVLSFDRDAAGSAASLRGAEYLQDLGARVYVLDFPDAKDPDEFLREQGREAFAAVLQERRLPYFEFKLELLLQQHDPASVYGKMEIAGGILEDLARLDNIVARDGYVQLVARRLGVSEDAVRQELLHFLNKRLRKDRIDKNRYNMEQGKQAFASPGGSAAEAARRGLFRLMCMDRKVWERVRQETGLAVFEGSLGRLVNTIAETAWGSPAAIIEGAAESDQAELAGLLMAGDDQEISQQQERLVADYLSVIKRELLSKEIAVRCAELQEYRKNEEKAGIMGVMAELDRLYKELQGLSTNG
ncbi:MAG: DNA primase [Thermacetogeniaceae bacterium]|jgi:DNA primase